MKYTLIFSQKKTPPCERRGLTLIRMAGSAKSEVAKNDKPELHTWSPFGNFRKRQLRCPSREQDLGRHPPTPITTFVDCDSDVAHSTSSSDSSYV